MRTVAWAERVSAAREAAVPVCVAPGMNAQSTAECTIMLLLMLAKRVDAARQCFADGVLGEPVRCEPSSHSTRLPASPSRVDGMTVRFGTDCADDAIRCR